MSEYRRVCKECGLKRPGEPPAADAVHFTQMMFCPECQRETSHKLQEKKRKEKVDPSAAAPIRNMSPNPAGGAGSLDRALMSYSPAFSEFDIQTIHSAFVESSKREKELMDMVSMQSNELTKNAGAMVRTDKFKELALTLDYQSEMAMQRLVEAVERIEELQEALESERKIHDEEMARERALVKAYRDDAEWLRDHLADLEAQSALCSQYEEECNTMKKEVSRMEQEKAEQEAKAQAREEQLRVAREFQSKLYSLESEETKLRWDIQSMWGEEYTAAMIKLMSTIVRTPAPPPLVLQRKSSVTSSAANLALLDSSGMWDEVDTPTRENGGEPVASPAQLTTTTVTNTKTSQVDVVLPTPPRTGSATSHGRRSSIKDSTTTN